ncbi:ferredoxin [Kitasatospora phosalacinea]|uniref:Ferredoxin n=1 Tax=Kitasatospora phosalacinea TaxID=2065 RepID=A0A9W6UNQ3_9ACTN|nr:PDR/VanB family oxidoreductase [Kitasatospora phosalacinea]GLW54387.1 ferredoxin [Kitasatospora phosalacinea]
MTAPEPTLDLLVTGRRDEAEGVVSLTLARPDGGSLPAWTPGAHLDLLLGDGLERQYSLCGDPADAAAWTVAVRREPGGRGGSAHVHDALHEGAAVRARGPRNHFALLPAPRYLFVAGGIGITPLVPMLAAAEAAGADWNLLYVGRSRATMAFAGHLADRYGPRVLLRPRDETARPDLAAHLDALDGRAEVYCCGPLPLLEAVERHRAQAGRPPAHVERFRPREPAGAGPERAFTLVLARSGLTLTVPADASVLDTVRGAGVDVLYSCGQGTCGTCETDVLDGHPEHRDSLLTEAERAESASMMVCVSRCLGERLVLDL